MINEKMKNQKGITLIALAITVTIILLLTGAIIYNLKKNIATHKLTALQSDIMSIRDKVSSYYEQYGAIPIVKDIVYTNIGKIQETGVISDAVDTGAFYVIKLSSLDNLTLNYGEDFEKISKNEATTAEQINNLEDLYIINEDSHNIFYVRGVMVDNQRYHTDYTQDKIDTASVPIVEVLLYNTGTTVEEAIKQDLPYEKNTTITDELGNKIKVPAGFKVIKDNSTDPTPKVSDGIVIQDATYEGTIGSEFVWIPVGTIKKSETETVTINLSRYTFDSEGSETDKGANAIDSDYTEDTPTSHDAKYKNAIATDIDDFKLKASAERSGGYYIGRYEARVENYDTVTKSNSDSKENWTGYNATAGKELQLVCKPNSQVWNYITQNKASEVSKNMYQDKTFASDLMNSYAWDTAILFIQKSTNENYANRNSLNTGNVANQGTNNLETDKQDKKCNIWDMASNCWEWTTETKSDISIPCVGRGGYYIDSNDYTSSRLYLIATHADDLSTFRPLLYL